MDRKDQKGFTLMDHLIFLDRGQYLRRRNEGSETSGNLGYETHGNPGMKPTETQDMKPTETQGGESGGIH